MSEDKSRKSSKGKGVLFALIIGLAIIIVIIGIILIVINNDLVTGTILVIVGVILVAVMNMSKVRAKFMMD